MTRWRTCAGGSWGCRHEPRGVCAGRSQHYVLVRVNAFSVLYIDIAVLPHGACDTLMCGASKNPSGSVEKEIVVFNEVLRRCAGIDVRAGCASTTQRPTCAHGVQEASSSKHRNQRIGVRRPGCACGEFVRTQHTESESMEWGLRIWSRCNVHGKRTEKVIQTQTETWTGHRVPSMRR